jgi:hypothetical protein
LTSTARLIRSTPSGCQIGNFPQAFTHLALIHAAIDLDAALNAGAGQAFQLPGGLGLPTALNLAAGQILQGRGGIGQQTA